MKTIMDNLRTIMLVAVTLIIQGCSTTNSIPYYADLRSLSAHNVIDPGTPALNGGSVGYGATPGHFYELGVKIRQEGNPQIYRQMLDDTNAAVRAMGAVCLSEGLPETELTIARLFTDRTPVSVTPVGCVSDRMTLGDFARNLIDDPEFRTWYLGPEARKKWAERQDHMVRMSYTLTTQSLINNLLSNKESELVRHWPSLFTINSLLKKGAVVLDGIRFEWSPFVLAKGEYMGIIKAISGSEQFQVDTQDEDWEAWFSRTNPKDTAQQTDAAATSSGQ